MRPEPRHPAALLAVAALVLSGCGAAPGEDEDPNGDAVAPEAPDPFEAAAVWDVGQWWVYRFVSPDGVEANRFTLVVAAADASTYTTSTDSRQTAAFNAEFDVSFVGPIARQDLSGRQGDQKVEYFRFPLAENASWPTRWDDLAVTVHALGADGADRFLLSALRPDGVEHAAYTYAPASGFFETIGFRDEEGAPGFSLVLDTWGHNWTGTLVDADATLVMHSQSNAPGPAAQDFTAPADTDDLAVRWSVECSGTGTWSFRMAPVQTMTPHEDAFAQDGVCPGQVAGEVVLEEAPPGTWGFASEWLAPPGQITWDVQAVARAYHETPFPPEA